MLKKSTKILLSFLIILFVIFIILYLRNFFILNNIANSIKNYSSTDNYYVKTISYEGTLTSVTNSYNIKEKYLTTIDYFIYTKDFLSKELYNDNETSITILEKNGTKVARLEKDAFGEIRIVNIFADKNLFALAFNNITTEKCNGKDCYSFNIDDIKYFIDKETGLLVRLMNLSKDNSSILDYYYEFDKVTDDNVKKPDISQYQVI